MTDQKKQKKKGKKKANKEPHIPPTYSTFFSSLPPFFSLIIIIFLFSLFCLMVSYDEDEVGVELGFFWLTKSE